MTEQPIDRVLPRLDRVKQRTPTDWIACCPAHPDDKQSLSISIGDKGNVLLKCFADCQTEAIVTTMGLTMADLFPPREANTTAAPRRIAKTYDYTDENGKLLYQVVRYEPKDFRQRQPDGNGGWIWSLKSVRRVLYGLSDVLKQSGDGGRVYLVEGEKDADALYQLGVCATTNAGGAAKWDDAFTTSLIGAEVIIIPDNDAPGRKHAQRVAMALHGKTLVRVLELPGLPEKGDVFNWILTERRRFIGKVEDFKSHARSLLETLVEGVPEWSPKAKTGTSNDLPDGLPFIECNRKHLRDKTQRAVCALLAANNPPVVFARSGKLVRIGIDEQHRPYIDPLNAQSMRGILARCANFFSTSEDRGSVPVAPPKDVVEDILSLPAWPDIPPLEGIVTAPVVAPDGSLVFTPGYLPQAAVYYHERHGLKLGDTEPTDSNITKAKSLLLDTVLGDFPFVDEASRAHSLALLFLPFVRPMINGPTPFHLVNAPTPGSGKSLLVKTCSAAFIHGGAAEQPAPGHDDEEWRKRITTALLSGGSHVWLDNISRKLDSGQFALVLTAAEWRDRMLGGNSEITVPVRCVWVGTGNNTSLSDEITRRTIEIRLDAEQERPWDRDSGQFKITNLSEWIREERGQLLTATLTLLRKWIADGRPLWQGKTLGSYESWSRILGGILQSIGVDGFLANRDDLYDRLDPEREKWCLFFKRWFGQHNSLPVGTADVIAIAVDCEIVAEDNRGNRNVLGKQLRHQCDRVYSGFRLVKGKEKDRASQYRVVPATHKGQNAPETPSKGDESNESPETNPPTRVGVSAVETPTRTEENHSGDSFDSSLRDVKDVTENKEEEIREEETDWSEFEDPFGPDDDFSVGEDG